MLTVFTVTETYDAVVTGPGDAPGTLRQAVFDANIISTGHDTIHFNVSAVTLDDFLTVTEPVKIESSGSGVSITPSSSYTGNTTAFLLHPDSTGGLGDFNAASTITLSNLNILGFVQPVRISGGSGSSGPAVPESVIITDNVITTATGGVFTLKSPAYALAA